MAPKGAPLGHSVEMTRDVLERYAVKVATAMQTVVHRKVMEYILPKARNGWIEIAEVESPLMMADAFQVLDDPKVQERMERLLTERARREEALVRAALGAHFGDSFGYDNNGLPLSTSELLEAKIAAIFRIVKPT